MLIKLTATEWIAGAVVDGFLTTRRADGNDYEVTVPKGAKFMVFRLSGPDDGSIKVIGAGDGDAWRSGKGNGYAKRSGAGDGDARRIGAGDGDAWRSGKGNGYAKRSGTGIGNAYVRGVKQ